MAYYPARIVQVDKEIYAGNRGVLTVKNAMLPPGLHKEEADLSRQNFQEIYERNKDRIGNPRYTISSADLAKLLRRPPL